MFERRFLRALVPRVDQTVNTLHVWTIASLAAHRYWKVPDNNYDELLTLHEQKHIKNVRKSLIEQASLCKRNVIIQKYCKCIIMNGYYLIILFKISRPVVSRFKDTVRRARFFLIILYASIAIYRLPIFLVELQIKWQPLVHIQKRPETTEVCIIY